MPTTRRGRGLTPKLFLVVGLCLVSFGAWGWADARPGIDEALIQDVLDRAAPSFWFRFDQSSQPRSSAALEHAGLIRRVTESDYFVQGVVFWLTPKGLRIASTHNWEADQKFLEIPVGRLVYIPGSQAAFINDWRPYVVLRAMFRGNDNARYLRELSPGAIWKVSFLGTQTLTLADLNRTVQLSLPLVRDKSNQWIPVFPRRPVTVSAH
jgi:hypothetical protein